MLMLIRFLAFWENSFKENIGKLCVRLEFNQNRGFYRLNKTSKVLWLNLNWWLCCVTGWENKTKKAKHRSEHTQHNQKQVKVWCVWSGDNVFFGKNGWIYTPTFPNTLGIYIVYLILELSRPFWTGIIDISHTWCKLNFGPLRSKVKSHHFL